VYGLFITGTSTEVGKTYVAAMIARALVRAGHRVGVYKPVASGCRPVGNQLVSADAELLWEAAGRPDSLERVCPQRFVAPLAPPRAAAAEEKRVDRDLLRSGLEFWRASSDIVLVEGAGGLMSPLSGDNSNVDYNADLAVDLGLPLVIVSANELGTINATLQTLITARSVAPELPISGIVLNHVTVSEDDCSVSTNARDIASKADTPLLTEVAYGQRRFSADVDWFALAQG